MTSWVLILIIVLLCLFLLAYLLYSQRKEAENLNKKLQYATQSAVPLRVEYSGAGVLKEITGRFNELVEINQSLEKQLEELRRFKSEGNKMAELMKSVEITLNHLKLINEIGKDISRQLEIEDVLLEFAKVIRSTVRVTEIHWVFSAIGQPVRHFIFTRDEKVKEELAGAWLESENNILIWAKENGKEVFLKNAVDDFARYVFNPPVMFNGKVAQSVICIPFNHQSKLIGAVGVFSDKQGDFDNYHLEFFTSLSTYLSTSMENAFLYTDIKKEKHRSDELLLNILPANVAEELKRSGNSKPRFHEMVTVMFTDFSDFTKHAERMGSADLVQEMDYLFGAFDDIMQQHKIEKIKTIGDAYMCVSGLNNEKDHAHSMALAAIDITAFMKKYHEERKLAGREFFEIRIGMHSGSVVSGVVGKSKFAFDIWGDTVNLASRLESSGVNGKINISGASYALLDKNFECTYRGKVAAKNKGEVDMYFLEGFKAKAT